MTARRTLWAAALGLAGLALVFGGPAAGQQAAGKSNPIPAATSAPAGARPGQEDQIAEGEKRFHANCGRCHQSPHKFPPRMVMTIERHMRVRATLTQEDMRAIVAFLTQ